MSISRLPIDVLRIITGYVFIDVTPQLLISNENNIDIGILASNPHAPPSYLEGRIRASVDEGKGHWNTFLQSNVCLSPKAMEEMKTIPYNPYLSLDFIRSNVEKFNLLTLAGSESITDEFILEHKERYVSDLMRNGGGRYMDKEAAGRCSIPISILREYRRSVPWYQYCQNKNISMEFLRENYIHIRKHEWNILCANPGVDVKFLLENAIYTSEPARGKRIRPIRVGAIPTGWGISINMVMRHCPVPFTFIQEKKLRVPWDCLMNNPRLPIEEFASWEIGPGVLRAMCRNVNITEAVLRENLDSISSLAKNHIKSCWSALCSNPNAPMRVLEENTDNIDWKELSRNPNLPVEIAKLYRQKIYWPHLASNSEFLRRLIEEELMEVLSDCL